MRHRSSVLNNLEENCPWALELLERGVPMDRRHFHTGSAAHLFCQAAGDLWKKVERPTEQAWDTVLETVLQELPSRLMSEGYRFDDGPPEPLPPRAVAEGVRIAYTYLQSRILSNTALYEHGLGITANGKPCDYHDPLAYVVALIDVYDHLPWSPDFEEEYRGAHVSDYKTAWQAGEGELDSLQRKIQLVLARAHNPDVDFIQGHVINLRTGMTHDTPRFWLRNEQDMDVLDRYWGDVKAVCKAADGPRIARPGVNCIGCPFAGRCAEGAVWTDYATDVVTRYATAKAAAAEMEPLVRALVAEDAVQVEGGLVGFQAKDVQSPQEDAHRRAVREFLGAPDDPANQTRWDADHEDVISMVKALKLGKGNLEAMARWLWPAPRDGGYEDFKERRDEFLRQALQTKTQARFGIWPGEK